MNKDRLARKAREERQQQFDALVQKIIDSGLYDDEDSSPDIIYNVARRPEIKSKLIKTFYCSLQPTDDLESMDVLWMLVQDYGTDDEETLDGVIEECGHFSPEDVQVEIDEFHARQKWLADDVAVAKFIRDYSYNIDIVIEAAEHTVRDITAGKRRPAP